MNALSQPRAETGEYRGLVTMIGIALVVALCYFAKAVIVPVVLAAMLAFLLAPVVIRLQRLGLPKTVAILSTALLAFSVLTAIGWMVSTQVVTLAEQLPRYEYTLRQKVRKLHESQQAPNAISRAGDVVKKLQQELEPEGRPASAAAPGAAPPEPAPVKVEIEPAELNVIESFAAVIGPFLGPLGTAGLVAIFVIAMLFQRSDLRDRFIRLVSGGRLNVATEAIDDFAKRMSRYLRMQLMVNTLYGIPIGVGLHFIGVPNAVLWGVLAILLRFIPYLGPWIAAAFPLILAFAVDPGWTTLLLTLALFLTAELIGNNVIEPWLYGVSTGISNFALMVAALFWTWLWGPVGLFLSTPLTVSLVVMGNYVPRLNFISVMLGSAPALEPRDRLYQRMLAMDYDEILALCREYLQGHTRIELYDDLIIPSLIAAESDRQVGALAEVRQRFILHNTMELIEELDEDRADAGGVDVASAATPRVLIVPAKDDVDELASRLLSRALAHAGIASRVLPATASAAECSQLLSNGETEVVCISSVPPVALAPIRRLHERLLAEGGAVTVMLGVWGAASEASALERRLARSSPAAFVTRIAAAVTRIEDLTALAAPGAVAACEPVGAGEIEPAAHAGQTEGPDDDPDETLDAVIRELANAFDVPISLASVIASDGAFWRTHLARADDAENASSALGETSVCAHVLSTDEPLVVEDIEKDGRFAGDAFLRSRGIRFYAGIALHGRTGHAVGSLCVIDTKPRQVTDDELAALGDLAKRLESAVQRHETAAA